MISTMMRLVRLKDLARKISDARTDEDFIDCFKELEATLPFSASPDQPLFLITPPTLKPPHEWQGLVADLPIPADSPTTMLEAGFMPLDNEVILHLTSGLGLFPEIDLGETPLCIDPDYGAILYEKNGRLRNLSLSTMAMTRYFQEVPDLAQYPALYHALGAMRGRKAYVGRLEGEYDEVLHLEVESRSQLDEIVDKLRNYIDRSPTYELWFRGQNNDYLLPDMSDLTQKRICLWRSVRDTSLVPSLYRTLPQFFSNIREYLALCFELAVVSFFIEDHLSIPPYSTRQGGEPVEERLEPKFQKSELRWTTTVSGGISGNEVRDYHHTFRDLQRFFFLQHYGLPSSVLDITHDLDIALFFAQHSFPGNRCRPIDPKKCAPVMYMFLLDKNFDLHLDSGKLSEHYGLLRPLRQRCGLISGASFVTKNDYSRLLALKISLRGPIEGASFDADYLMPGPDEDGFLSSLLEFCDDQGFSRIRPFVLQEG